MNDATSEKHSYETSVIASVIRFFHDQVTISGHSVWLTYFQVQQRSAIERHSFSRQKSRYSHKFTGASVDTTYWICGLSPVYSGSEYNFHSRNHHRV